jgi:hypothetical protein
VRYSVTPDTAPTTSIIAKSSLKRKLRRGMGGARPLGGCAGLTGAWRELTVLGCALHQCLFLVRLTANRGS